MVLWSEGQGIIPKPGETFQPEQSEATNPHKQESSCEKDSCSKLPTETPTEKTKTTSTNMKICSLDQDFNRTIITRNHSSNKDMMPPRSFKPIRGDQPRGMLTVNALPTDGLIQPLALRAPATAMDTAISVTPLEEDQLRNSRKKRPRTNNSSDSIAADLVQKYKRQFSFPVTLHQMLERCEIERKHNRNSLVMAWLPGGKSFKIYDETRFEKEILPAFAKELRGNSLRDFLLSLHRW